MFDCTILEAKHWTAIKESKGKVNAKYINIEDGKQIILHNHRRDDHFRITLQLSENSIMGILDSIDDDRETSFDIKYDGSITVVIYEDILNLYIKKNVLYIICADEIKIYE